MKKLISLFTPALLILCISIAFNACNDPCKGVDCLNGGTCVEGDCDCPAGFTGKSCETEIDPCEGVTCFNGGTCDNGDCDCPPGYTGSNCTIVDCNNFPCVNGTLITGNGTCDCFCDQGWTGYDCSQPVSSGGGFLGTYSVSENCNSGTYTYNISISAAITPNEIVISNFGGYGIDIRGFVSGNNLSIPSQTESGVTISGSGYLSGTVLSITYYATDGTASDNCTMTCIK